MGVWLRRARLERHARLKDVGDAIGRGPQYVCDVEHGRRGARMDPVVVLLWCEYLVLDPAVMFAYLSLGDTDLQRFRIQHYLETGAWAVKFMKGKKALDRAQRDLKAAVTGLPAGVQKSQLRLVLAHLETVQGALRVPHMRKNEGSGEDEADETADVLHTSG
jgi:transcriptional regulator with XRE-family HTH domain